MDRDRAGHLHGADDRRDIEIAVAGRIGADAHGFVGEAHVLEVGVHLGVHGHRLDVQLLAGAQHAQGDLAAVGDQHFAQHGGGDPRLK
jgi:alpha-D-ribose 1-methylphosphonate 5-triphosphate synthase subunit PhnG